MNLQKVAKVVAIVLIITGVMQAISLGMKEVPIEEIPEVIRPWWQYALLFISSIPWAALVGLGRNIWGYVRVYYRNGGELEYAENKLKETMALYGGVIVTITAIASLLPPPYDQIFRGIGTTIFVLMELTLSELRHFRETK